MQTDRPNIQTYENADRQSYRQTEIQTDRGQRQTAAQTDTQTDRQTTNKLLYRK